MRQVVSSLLFMSCLFFPQQGYGQSTQYASNSISYASSGWVSPGQNVTISAKITSNINWTPITQIGYRLVSISSGVQIASQYTAPQSAGSNTYSVSQTIAIPTGTPAGRYRASLEVVGSANGSTVTLWSDPRSVCINVVSSPSPLANVGIRGCSELPSTYLSTQGSQIVDANNVPVRITSLGWGGLDGGAGSSLSGLFDTGYKNLMNSAKEAGFNAIRIAYSDSGLYTRPNTSAQYPINHDYNSDLLDPSYPQPNAQGQYTFLPTMGILQKVVAYAGQIGLKVIFDHHQNEGNYSGNTPNGLWFDLDPQRGMDSDCSVWVNGQATHNGTITYNQFKANLVSLASTFANNPTVIGLELHNEPSGLPYTWSPSYCTPVRLNWGVTNDPYDIHYMAQDVGNAIGAVNPNVLVILEGDFEKGPPSSSGMNPNVLGLAGDLTAVGGWGWGSSTPPNPVVLTVPHKMVYSIHLYPWEVSNAEPVGTGYGPTYVQDWNNSWGYLVSQNIAPVLITEVGAFIESQDYRGNGSGTTSADALAFMGVVVPYLNGQGVSFSSAPYNGIAGPTVGNGSRQPVGFDWWALGAVYSAKCCGPNGIEIWAGSGDFNPDQIAYTDAMQYKGAINVTPYTQPEATPSGTTIAVGGVINDTQGNIWAISDGKVIVNGSADSTTANVIEMAYVNGLVWQLNAAGMWYSKASPSNTWSTGTSLSPLPASPSTFIHVNGGSAVVDGHGNSWSLGSGLVMTNGARDIYTASMVAVAYKNNLVYALNNAPQWYSKSTTSPGGWNSASSPLTTSPNNSVVFEGGGSVVDANNNFWSIVNGTVMVNGVTDTTTANVIELAYVGGRIWQMNSNRLWWSKGLPSDTWAISANSGQTRPAIATSTDKTITVWGSFGLSDSQGEDWGISSDYRVMNNGLVDQSTGNVVKLTYYNNRVWQQNSAGNWWYKASMSDVWHASTGAPY